MTEEHKYRATRAYEMTRVRAAPLAQVPHETILPGDKALYYNEVYRRRFVTVVSRNATGWIVRRLNGLEVEVGHDCLALTRCAYCKYGYSAHTDEGKCIYGPGRWLDVDTYLRDRGDCVDYP